jgi:hypothetical protein
MGLSYDVTYFYDANQDTYSLTLITDNMAATDFVSWIELQLLDPDFLANGNRQINFL